jgi:ABC-type polysaccharide/polyol phosphate export permease
LPLSAVVAKLVDFGIALLIRGAMAIHGAAPTQDAFALPLLVLLTVVAAAGLGMRLAALALQ